MIKVSQKKNISSLQVLKTLKVLLEGDYTMQEIVDKLNCNEEEPIFNNSVVSKYINTCRFCGIITNKINGKYYVTEMPFGFRLSSKEFDLIENLVETIKENLTSRQSKFFNSLVAKINRHSDKQLSVVNDDNKVTSFEFFERAVTERRKVRLVLKNHLELTGIPIRVIDINNKSFFNIYCKNRERMVDTKRVSGIKILNEKYAPFFSDQSVLFRLKGKLAQRYQLRENETIMPESEPGTITISNRGENKDILLSRLLRYDDLCEILSPKSFREEMMQIVNDTLANYGEN